MTLLVLKRHPCIKRKYLFLDIQFSVNIAFQQQQNSLITKIAKIMNSFSTHFKKECCVFKKDQKVNISRISQLLMYILQCKSESQYVKEKHRVLNKGSILLYGEQNAKNGHLKNNTKCFQANYLILITIKPQKLQIWQFAKCIIVI